MSTTTATRTRAQQQQNVHARDARAQATASAAKRQRPAPAEAPAPAAEDDLDTLENFATEITPTAKPPASPAKPATTNGAPRTKPANGAASASMKDEKKGGAKSEDKAVVPYGSKGGALMQVITPSGDTVQLQSSGYPLVTVYPEPVNPLAKVLWFEQQNGAFWKHIVPYAQFVCTLNERTIDIGFWPRYVDRASAPEELKPKFGGLSFVFYGSLMNRGTMLGPYGNLKCAYNNNLNDKYAAPSLTLAQYVACIRKVPVEVLQRIGISPTHPCDSRFAFEAMRELEDQLKTIYATNPDVKSLRKGNFYGMFKNENTDYEHIVARTHIFVQSVSQAQKDADAAERKKQEAARLEEKKRGLADGTWTDEKENELLPMEKMPEGIYDPAGYIKKVYDDHKGKYKHRQFSFTDDSDESIDMDLRVHLGPTEVLGFPDVVGAYVTLGVNKQNCHGGTFYLDKLRLLVQATPKERQLNERVLDSGEVAASNFKSFMPIPPQYQTGFMKKIRAQRQGAGAAGALEAPRTPMPSLAPPTPVHPSSAAASASSASAGSGSMQTDADGGVDSAAEAEAQAMYGDGDAQMSGGDDGQGYQS